MPWSSPSARGSTATKAPRRQSSTRPTYGSTRPRWTPCGTGASESAGTEPSWVRTALGCTNSVTTCSTPSSERGADRTWTTWRWPVRSRAPSRPHPGAGTSCTSASSWPTIPPPMTRSTMRSTWLPGRGRAAWTPIPGTRCSRWKRASMRPRTCWGYSMSTSIRARSSEGAGTPMRCVPATMTMVTASWATDG